MAVVQARWANVLVSVFVCAASAACGNSGPSPLDVGSDDSADGSPGSSFAADGSVPTGTSLDVAATAGAPQLCPGQCTSLAATATGGNGHYTFQWDHGLVVDGGAVTVCPSTTTTYGVTAVDTSGHATGELTSANATGIGRVTVTVADCAIDAGSGGARVYWTDWSTESAGATGSFEGSLPLPSGSVTVSYAGEVGSQSQTTDGSVSYWTPATTYTSATVANPPATPGIIALIGGNATVDTLTFSRPVTNPVMAILSLGGLTTSTFAFDAPFEILSNGPGYFGVLFGGMALAKTDAGLVGREANGLVQFTGTFTTIHWTVPVAETWSGFTVGVRGP